MQYNSRKWYNDFSRVRSEESAMKLSKDIVLEYMQNQALNHSESISFTTQELSDALQMQRSNLSKLLRTGERSANQKDKWKTRLLFSGE